MAAINRKAVRAAAGQFAQLADDALLRRAREPMTRTERLALERVLAGRGLKMPEGQGEVTPDDEPEQRVITLEDLGGEPRVEKKASPFGVPESAALVAGVAVMLLLWQGSEWIAIAYGLVAAAFVWSALHWIARSWRELGRYK
ncbi:MAG: hypothetical protein HUK26_07570 [Duodenibacillus sp.]|nr:hypothetical protein [Duodenibacillus sp.]